MTVLSPGLRYVDVLFQGKASVIATAVLEARGRVALVDPGPSTTLDRLRSELAAGGIAIADLESILLTHIHLDHAGATGSLVAENPRITVYVHERGAPHLIDPAKLLASATRLYGDRLDRLFGPFLPVPADRVVALAGGETLEAAGRPVTVAYTPGHASHHVSYFDRDSRIAFVGDAGGVALAGAAYVLPPTPPPDVDLEAWRESEARILAWEPDTLFLTHFGPFHGARQHFHELMSRLDEWSSSARRLVADEHLTEETREQQFVDEALLDLKRIVGVADAEQYRRAGSIAYSWQGLARYWRKRSK